MMKRSRLEEAILLPTHNPSGRVNPDILDSLENEVKDLVREFWVSFYGSPEDDDMLDELIKLWWNDDG